MCIRDSPELAAQRAFDVSEWQKTNPTLATPTTQVDVGLRALSGADTAQVYERARAYCKRNGLDNPREADPLYDLALSVYTLAIACVDPDSDVHAPKPFFGPAENWTPDLAADHI